MYIFYEINKSIEAHNDINTDVLCIDGSKYEANANKNTFIWRGNTLRNRTKRLKMTLSYIKRINQYFKRNNMEVRYSLLKEPSIDYFLTISGTIKNYMKDINIDFVHDKDKRKSEILRLYDELKNNASK